MENITAERGQLIVSPLSPTEWTVVYQGLTLGVVMRTKEMYTAGDVATFRGRSVLSNQWTFVATDLLTAARATRDQYRYESR